MKKTGSKQAEETIRNPKIFTCDGEFVHFSHQKALISEQHWSASFIIFRCKENTASALNLSSSTIVYIDIVRKFSVLQMSESGENISTGNEIKAT